MKSQLKKSIDENTENANRLKQEKKDMMKVRKLGKQHTGTMALKDKYVSNTTSFHKNVH